MQTKKKKDEGPELTWDEKYDDQDEQKAEVVDRGRKARDAARATKAMNLAAMGNPHLIAGYGQYGMDAAGNAHLIAEEEVEAEPAGRDPTKPLTVPLAALAAKLAEDALEGGDMATKIVEEREKQVATASSAKPKSVAAPSNGSPAEKPSTKPKTDARSNYLMSKFNLNEEAVKCLAEAIGRHQPAKRKEYYVDLAMHLKESKRPSGKVMRLVEHIRLGEPLGPVEEEEEEDDMEIEHFKMKYQFSDAAVTSLAEAVAYHEQKKRQSYYIELEQVLDDSSDPRAALEEVVAKIRAGDPLLMPWLGDDDDDDDDDD
jgi:hypothetical protein